MREYKSNINNINVDDAVHKLMSADFSQCCGRTEIDEYIAFYHQSRLYSVKNNESGIVSLVYAENPYKAIEMVRSAQICLNCGNDIRGLSYCPNCGKKVERMILE